jgi:hypothetical protein
MADKDFRVKNKLHVNGLNNASGVILATNNALDSHTTLPTQYGGTGTTTSPTSGQILYSSSGTTYSPTTLSSLDVKGATYSADAPASPFVGQVWIESDSSSDSFDPNIMRRKSFTATAGQTVFTTDYVFIDGYEQVYFNGMLLLRNTDYTTSGSTYTVTLASAAALNDIVEVVTITNLNSINTATTTTNTFTGTQTIQGTSASSFGVDISQTNTSSLMRVGFDDSSGLAQIGNWSNNSLRFLTNASERMRIDSSGNIGIGVSSPTSKLHVETSGTNYITSRNGAAGSGIAGLILQNSGDTRGIRINGSSLELYDHSAGVARATIDADGNMLIGTSSGTYGKRLTVHYNSAADQVMSIRNTNATGLSSIRLEDNNGSYMGDIGYYNASGSQGIRIGGNAAVNVYIPGSKLAIGATAVSSGMLEVTHTDATAPRFISTSNSNNKLMVFEGYAGSLWNLWGGHGGGSYFGISENASTTPVFAITGTTNYVLIGYTSSQGAYKLQVNSQIFATSSSIATSDGRYKENIDTITGGLDIVDSLRPVSFTWKDHPVHNFVEGKTVGFIAQEVKESLSQYDWVDNIIKTNTSDAILDEDGNEVTPAEEFLGIAESNIIPLLVAAVKELKTRVETLEAK